MEAFHFSHKALIFYGVEFDVDNFIAIILQSRNYVVELSGVFGFAFEMLVEKLAEAVNHQDMHFSILWGNVRLHLDVDCVGSYLLCAGKEAGGRLLFGGLIKAPQLDWSAAVLTELIVVTGLLSAIRAIHRDSSFLVFLGFLALGDEAGKVLYLFVHLIGNLTVAAEEGKHNIFI